MIIEILTALLIIVGFSVFLVISLLFLFAVMRVTIAISEAIGLM